MSAKEAFVKSAAVQTAGMAGTVAPYAILVLAGLGLVWYVNHKYSVSQRVSEAKERMDNRINENYQEKFMMSEKEVQNLQASVRAGVYMPVPEEEAEQLRKYGISVATPAEFYEWVADPNAYMRKVAKDQGWEY